MSNVAFADDVPLICESLGEQKNTLERLANAPKKLNLKLNYCKTKIIPEDNLLNNIKTNGKNFKVDRRFIYLGLIG